jgi:hypothetical protein
MSKPVVYTAQSKQFFYCRDAVCEFVFRRNAIPINPFRLFDYFLGDRVERDAVRAANAEMLSRCDEVWVFGETLADGVLVEIAQATNEGKTVRYFTIHNEADRIQEVDPQTLSFEGEVHQDTGLDKDELLHRILCGRSSDLLTALGRPLRVTA